MRFWVARGTTTTIKEQLISQLLLAIFSGRFTPGERLPSVRQLARRLGIHANTISAVYQELAARGWVEQRPGSGVYVRPQLPPPTLDSLIERFLAEASAAGHPPAAVLEAVSRAVHPSPVPQRAVIDPDPALAEVIAAELSVQWNEPIRFGDSAAPPPGCQLWASAGRLPALERGVLPVRLVAVEDILAQAQRPPAGRLLAVVSISPTILEWSARILSALGVAPEAVLLRNPRDEQGLDGLSLCASIGADVVAARLLPTTLTYHVFRVVAVQKPS
jgi:DNA-binding transcriptional regulator YhcF (GntR family)